MSIFEQISTSPGGVPVYVVIPGYKPCEQARPGGMFRARALEMCDGRLRCPGCDNACQLPHTIGPGNEFMVHRYPEPAGRK